MIKLIKWIIFYLNIIYKLHSIIHLSSARQSRLSYRIFQLSRQSRLSARMILCKTIKIVCPNMLCQDNLWLSGRKNISAKTIRHCLTEINCLQDNGCGFPDNSQLSDRMVHRKTIWDCLPEFALPRQLDCLTDWILARQSKLSGRMHSAKTIKDCLTEWRSARQSLIVWPNGDCLTELWIVLLALKLSFCCVLCLQGNLKLSCPCYFVFATHNCLVFQLSYKYKCFAYKYGIASFIFSVHSLCNQSICKAFKLFVTCLIVISTVFCALITRLF